MNRRGLRLGIVLLIVSEGILFLHSSEILRTLNMQHKSTNSKKQQETEGTVGRQR